MGLKVLISKGRDFLCVTSHRSRGDFFLGGGGRVEKSFLSYTFAKKKVSAETSDSGREEERQLEQEENSEQKQAGKGEEEEKEGKRKRKKWMSSEGG